MLKRLWTILGWVIAILAIGGGVFFLFYDKETLFMYGALAAILCAVFVLVAILLDYMPKKDEGKEKK